LTLVGGGMVGPNTGASEWSVPVDGWLGGGVDILSGCPLVDGYGTVAGRLLGVAHRR